MSTVHVVPLGDLIEHRVPGGLDGHDQDEGSWLSIEADPDADDEFGCACGPAVEHVPNPDGPDGWVVTHHSLDGRERTE